MDKFIYVQVSACRKTTYCENIYGGSHFVPSGTYLKYLEFKYNKETNNYTYLDYDNVLWYICDDFKYVTGYGHWYAMGRTCVSTVRVKNISTKLIQDNKYTLLKKEYIKQKQEIENLEFKIKYTKNHYDELKTKILEGKI